MRIRNVGSWTLGVSLTVLSLISNCLAQDLNPSNPEQTPTEAVPAASTQTQALEEAGVAPSASTSTNDISTAPFQQVTEEKPVPLNIHQSRPLAEIVKLVNSGVEEHVLMAFVTNSASTFNLSAEEIIYLKDIGVPDVVVTAMIVRDQALRENSLIASAQVPEPPVAASAPEVAPQPDAAAQQYPPEPGPPAGEIASDAGFYNALAPYGNWVDVEGYGRCWQPTVVVANPGWQPYYDCGRWIYSDCGWYWVSDYSWGWAPFHYGRWFRHNHLGWCWMPDTVWGASWVSWRYTDNYCGWAPLPPGAYFTVGVGLTYHGHHVRHFEDCGLRPSNYRFVAWNHFHDRDFHHYRLAPEHRDQIYNHSVVATGFTGDNHRIKNDGLPPQKVATSTGTPLRPVAIREVGGTARVGGRVERFEPSNRTVTIYRPGLGQTTPRTTGTKSSGVAPRTGSQSAAPIILRGPQNSATKETPPPNSVVVIGRKNPDGSQTFTRTTVPSANRPAPSALAERSATWTGKNSATPWADNEVASEAPMRETPGQNAWRQGTPDNPGYRSPVYVPRNNVPGSQYQQRPNPGYMPSAPSSQPSARSGTANPTTHYTPPPSFNAPQRSTAAPAPAPAPSRPPVEARPAPSAPPQSGPAQPGNRNPR